MAVDGYDALLVVSFGGPEGPDDVMPFLENVTRGRNIPRERLAEVAASLRALRRRQPDQPPESRADRRARGRARRARRSSSRLLRQPQLAPVPRRHAAGHARRRRRARARVLHLGVQLLLGLPPVPRGHLPRAGRGRARTRPRCCKLRAFYNHPGFVEANADRVRDALAQIPEERRRRAPRLHRAQHPVGDGRAAAATRTSSPRRARLVAEAVGAGGYSVVYQSRSGSPHGPVARARRLRPPARARARRASRDVVVSPVGFVSDHMEVLFDLDVEAAATRAPSSG